MIVVDANIDLLKDPSKVYEVRPVHLSRLKMLGQEGKIIFIMPKHLKNSKDKRQYKVGFLNELYLALYPDWKKKNIFEAVTGYYDIFLEIRQYQIDVKDWTEKKYTKFVV